MGFQYSSHWLQWIIHVTENCHTASFLLLHASIISKSWFNRELGSLTHWVSPSLSYSYVADSIGSFLSSLMLSPFITILTSENMEAQSRTNRIWFRWTLHVKQTKICILVYCIFWQLYTYSTNWSNGILKVKKHFLDAGAKQALSESKMSHACAVLWVVWDSYWRGEENIHLEFQAVTKRKDVIMAIMQR